MTSGTPPTPPIPPVHSVPCTTGSHSFQDKAIETYEKAVEFCGYKSREELCDMFQEVDALVSSSRKEAFGVVITEALCCGLPIVVTKSGGPEGIVNTLNGYLAEKENALVVGHSNTTPVFANRILDEKKLLHEV